MAEGDTILRLARRIDGEIAGKRLTVTAPGPRPPMGLPVESLDGRMLERAESRGKHLLLHFEGGIALHSHLGMRGSWHLYARGERWRRPRTQAWIALATEPLEAVNFGGSTVRIARDAELRRDPRLSRLGPDLLAGDFAPTEAVRRMRSVDAEIQLGEALLGQRLVAGIGNIFKSEGCFAAGLNPHSPLGSLTDEQLGSVLEETRSLMLAAVDSGRPPGRVYRMAGRPCPRCGARIRSAAQGDSARASYWCPRCQPQA